MCTLVNNVLILYLCVTLTVIVPAGQWSVDDVTTLAGHCDVSHDPFGIFGYYMVVAKIY